MRHLALLALLACVPTADDDTGVDTDVDATAPELVVDATLLDLGTVVPGCDAGERTLALTNAGDAPLHVAALAVEGTGADAFTVDPAGPLDLPAGGTQPVVVAFAPEAWRRFAASLRITSDDPAAPDRVVALVGTGGPVAEVVEHYEQAPPRKIDVALASDTTCSMSSARLPAVGERVDEFLAAIEALGLDFHVGAATADLADGGKLLGPWATADMDPAAAAELLSAALSGTTTSEAPVQVLAASKAAVTKAPEGFLRDDAALGLVAISHVDDADAGSDVPDRVVAWLDGLKGPELSAFSALTCGPGGGGSGGCGGLLAVADRTGGVTGDLGAEPFDPVPFLVRATAVSAGMTDTFRLSEVPLAPDDLVVTLDGEPVPRDRAHGWTWDDDRLAVAFLGDLLPPPGSEVRVRYAVDPGCAGAH